MLDYLTTLVILTGIYALFSLGLNLQWGFTGLINFGQVAFMTLGAYATVLLSQSGVPLILAVLVGAAIAALLGLLIGLSTLRLRDDYLAIVTIGVSELVRLVALNEEWLTRGPSGIYGYPLPLEKLTPNGLGKSFLIGTLTYIVGIALWKLWQGIRQSLKQGSRLLVLKNSCGWAIYGISGVGVLYGILRGAQRLKQANAVPPGIQGLALFLLLVGFCLLYSWIAKKLIPLMPEWSRGLTLLSGVMVTGFALWLYIAGAIALYNYSYRAGLMWLLVVVLAVTFWYLERLVRSPWGRVIKAIREDEQVTKALGKNVFAYKLQSLMIGGFIAGIAGAFYAWQLTFINPDGFIPLITFQAWIIVVLGGAGNNLGTLLGAIIYWAYDTVTRFILKDIVPLDDARLGAFRIMVIGLILMVLMVWRPQGILGKKAELTLSSK